MRRLAAQLAEARRTLRAIVPPPERALSLGRAYDVQDVLVTSAESSGRAISGWKLGLTSAVKQCIMGIDRPVYGRLFADGSIHSGATVARASFIAPRAEPELAFGLNGPFDAAADAADELASVAWIAPALEITDSRYAPGTRTASELVADNTSSAAYVIGPRTTLERAPRLATIATTIVRNGAVLAAGSTADVLGDPAAALALLARHLRERGLAAKAGDIVLSGAITDAFSAVAGDRFEAHLTGLGSAVVHFV